MSEYVSIMCEVEICVYTVTCSGCNQDLVINGLRADTDGDLRVDVDACDTCMTNAMDEGYEAGKEEALA